MLQFDAVGVAALFVVGLGKRAVGDTGLKQVKWLEVLIVVEEKAACLLEGLQREQDTGRPGIKGK